MTNGAPEMCGSQAKDWALSKPRTGTIASARQAFREKEACQNQVFIEIVQARQVEFSPSPI